MEGLAAISGFFFLCSFILSVVILVIFFVMASNIGSIAKSLRRLEGNSISMKNALERIDAKDSSRMMNDADKAAAYDREQTKLSR